MIGDRILYYIIRTVGLGVIAIKSIGKDVLLEHGANVFHKRKQQKNTERSFKELLEFMHPEVQEIKTKKENGVYYTDIIINGKRMQITSNAAINLKAGYTIVDGEYKTK